MLLNRIILLIILIAAPLTTPAKDTAAKDVYFNANAISPTLLSLPFANKSPQQSQELKYIMQLQKKPDPAEIVLALSERNMTAETIATIIPQLQRKDYPALYTLLDKVGNTSRSIANTAKEYWKTDRPYIVDTNVKALIESHSNHSYPSGHTSRSYTWAHVMNLLLPDHSQKFYDKAQTIANHRALVGMHFPHDLEGGRQLALLTIGSLLQTQDFITDLEKAKQELKSHPIRPEPK